MKTQKIQTLKDIVDQRGHHVCLLNDDSDVMITSYRIVSGDVVFYDNTGKSHEIDAVSLRVTISTKDDNGVYNYVGI